MGPSKELWTRRTERVFEVGRKASVERDRKNHLEGEERTIRLTRGKGEVKICCEREREEAEGDQKAAASIRRERERERKEEDRTRRERQDSQMRTRNQRPGVDYGID